jgi:predicted esterase
MPPRRWSGSARGPSWHWKPQQHPALASRVLAFSGRFASLPVAALPQTTVHLFHGKADPVIPYVHSVQAAEHLIALGGDVTAEIEPFVGHQLHEDLLEKRWNTCNRIFPNMYGMRP